MATQEKLNAAKCSANQNRETYYTDNANLTVHSVFDGTFTVTGNLFSGQYGTPSYQIENVCQSFPTKAEAENFVASKI